MEFISRGKCRLQIEFECLLACKFHHGLSIRLLIHQAPRQNIYDYLHTKMHQHLIVPFRINHLKMK
jgi:hypothetical protein